MVDSSIVSAWIDGYVRAWNSNAPSDIGSLFTDDAAYYAGPFDAPWRGRKNIVQNWLARQDAPGSTTFRYEVLVATDDTGVVRGWTEYHAPRRTFSNIWLIRFDKDGRCREFTEWWVQKPEQ